MPRHLSTIAGDVMRSRVSFHRDQFRRFERHVLFRLERAALRATAAAARGARDEIRAAMAGGALGRLGQAIGAGSDLARGRIYREGGGFSASGEVHIRGRSERTRGTIEAYTDGADIAPRRGGWLWIATAEIPRRAGRRKMTPALYNSTGLDQRIGPLVFRPGRHPGEALLIVSGATLHRSFSGRARRLPKRGRVGETRTGAVSFVAFVGIRKTRRSARLDPAAIIRKYRERLPQLIGDELERHDR